MERGSTRKTSRVRGRGGADGVEGGPQRVERLRRSFAKFRRGHRCRTRIPDTLRNAALAAIDGGTSEAEVRRACGVTSDQLAQWRIGQRGRRPAAVEDGPAAPLVFPVVDDSTEAGKQGEGLQDLWLQLGRWSIYIRQVEA